MMASMAQVYAAMALWVVMLLALLALVMTVFWVVGVGILRFFCWLVECQSAFCIHCWRPSHGG